MKYFIIFLLLISFLVSYGQETKYKISAVGFYNVENLFDTVDSEDTNDQEFTPTGLKQWTEEKYAIKLTNMATVIKSLGTEKTKDGLAFLGLAEVENYKVLEDLVNHRIIKSRKYAIIHEDSPDRRGIDVAMIYQPSLFTPISHKYYPLLIYRSDQRIYTRDILYVNGLLDGESIHVLVNHWPSRSGGEKRSRPSRNAAALLCKNISDSIRIEEPNAKIIIMGDFNDDPISPSLKRVLDAREYEYETPKDGFFNPMYAFYKKGIGSNAYRDAWSLFDQIIVSQSFLPKDQKGFFFYQAVIHNKNELLQPFGQYKGYPFRTFSGDTFIGGYSDHFPVYLYLLKEVN